MEMIYVLGLSNADQESLEGEFVAASHHGNAGFVSSPAESVLDLGLLGGWPTVSVAFFRRK